MEWKCFLGLAVIGYLNTVSLAETDYKDCTYNFQTLEDALMADSQNVYSLKTTFTPPHADSPLYITVTYSFPDNTSVDYIWTTAVLFFTVHPRILGYLSLLFSFIEDDRIVNLQLDLPQECSELTDITTPDTSNFLYILSHRLEYYSGDRAYNSKDDHRVYIVLAEQLKFGERKEHVNLFFSLVFGLPIAILMLAWITVRAAFPLIRSCVLNNPDAYPCVAALYWIGQTFTLFIIVLDIHALSQNVESNLLLYQLIMVTMLEIFSLLLSFVFAVLSLISHHKEITFETTFKRYFTVFCCGVVSFRDISTKEARVWLFLSSLITPIVSISSHAGFIIGGWVSYEDRSIAIFLMYLFIFVFLHWSLQHLYEYSTSFAHRYIRIVFQILTQGKKPQKRTQLLKICKKMLRLKSANRAVVDETDGGGDMLSPLLGDHIHHEKEMAKMAQQSRRIGFDTLAVFLMLFLIPLPYGVVLYFGFGLAIPLLTSIDSALLQIFSLGRYSFYVAVFIVTYKIFTVNTGGGGGQGLVSNDALSYWKFLNRDSERKTPKTALKASINNLILMLSALTRESSCVQVKKYKLQLDVAKNRLKHAEQQFSTDSTNPHLLHKLASKLLEVIKIMDTDRVELDESEGQLDKSARELSVLIKDLADEQLPGDQRGLELLSSGINEFQKALMREIGIPPMTQNKDKANALTAVLIYRQVNSLNKKIKIKGYASNQGPRRNTREETRATQEHGDAGGGRDGGADLDTVADLDVGADLDIGADLDAGAGQYPGADLNAVVGQYAGADLNAGVGQYAGVDLNAGVGQYAGPGQDTRIEQNTTKESAREENIYYPEDNERFSLLLSLIEEDF